ncbi:MAG: DUF3106 domain-containing protein, partial [Woeseia sp.]
MKAEWMVSIFASLLLVISGASMAQDENISWDSLSEEQQRVLGPIADSWDTLVPERQARLSAGAQRWAGMSRRERAAAQKRFQAWRSLTDEQRDVIRSRYRDFQRMSPLFFSIATNIAF